MTVRVTLLTTAAFAALALSPIAHADAGSDFMAALRAHGLITNPHGSIQNARGTCTNLSRGSTRAREAADWYGADRGMGHSPSITLADAEYMVDMSIRYFCPGHGY
jgi:Protein of unknown function (DUF732)